MVINNTCFCFLSALASLTMSHVMVLTRQKNQFRIRQSRITQNWYNNVIALGMNTVGVLL